MNGRLRNLDVEIIVPWKDLATVRKRRVWLYLNSLTLPFGSTTTPEEFRALSTFQHPDRPWLTGMFEWVVIGVAASLPPKALHRRTYKWQDLVRAQPGTEGAKAYLPS